MLVFSCGATAFLAAYAITPIATFGLVGGLPLYAVSTFSSLVMLALAVKTVTQANALRTVN